MSRRSYGDEHDTIPAATLPTEGPSWQAHDELLVQRAASYLKSRSRVRALDVGAGQGRLLPALAAAALAVVGIEPDARRAHLAAGVADRLGDRVEVLVTDALGFQPDAPFDLVVCSHVIQHLPARDRTGLVQALGRLCADGGAVLTTHSCTGREAAAFFVSGIDETTGRASTTAVDRSAFEAWFDREDEAPASPELPVWHAGLREVSELHHAAGLKVKAFGVYRTFAHMVWRGDGRVVRQQAHDAFVIATSA